MRVPIEDASTLGDYLARVYRTPARSREIYECPWAGLASLLPNVEGEVAFEHVEAPAAGVVMFFSR